MNTIVLSVGGSLIAPDKIDTSFISQLKKSLLASGHRFVIVVGGGKTCRDYQDAARSISSPSENDLDWIGIAATHLNAELLRSVFGPLAYDKITINPAKKVKTSKQIIVAAGWKPGHSTDYDTVCLAQTYGATAVINMTNVDYLYDKNPKEFADAKKITKATWSQLQKIVGTEWKPGLNRPFDPIATKLGAKLKLKLIIVGSDVKNLENVIQNKPFKGTTIS
jgi:uridylate kinase